MSVKFKSRRLARMCFPLDHNNVMINALYHYDYDRYVASGTKLKPVGIITLVTGFSTWPQTQSLLFQTARVIDSLRKQSYSHQIPKFCRPLYKDGQSR